MALTSFKFFNFYRRYKWTAQNFTDLMSTVVGLNEGVSQGLAGPSVLSGLGYVSNTNLVATVAAGIGVNADGKLCVSAGGTVTFAAPAGNPCKSLCVLRPIDTNSDFITNPVSPFNSVPLDVVRTFQIVAINGTPGVSPAYPSIVAGDIILFGVALASGASTFASTAVDLVVRDRIGKSSDLGLIKHYHYIVSATSAIATHRTFAAFCADSSVVAGSRVLVQSSETINATCTISIANLLIEFYPGITLTNGSAGTGISVAAAGVRLKGARFSGFTTAISIANGNNNGFVTECRFASCTNEITDNNASPNNVAGLNISE